MQQQSGTTAAAVSCFGGYNPGIMPHSIPTFFSSQQQNEIYQGNNGSGGGNPTVMDSITMTTTTNENSAVTSANRFDAPTNIQQLEALAAAVHVSSSDYSIDETLLHSTTVLGGGNLSLTAPVW